MRYIIWGVCLVFCLSVISLRIKMWSAAVLYHSVRYRHRYIRPHHHWIPLVSPSERRYRLLKGYSCRWFEKNPAHHYFLALSLLGRNRFGVPNGLFKCFNLDIMVWTRQIVVFVLEIFFGFRDAPAAGAIMSVGGEVGRIFSILKSLNWGMERSRTMTLGGWEVRVECGLWEGKGGGDGDGVDTRPERRNTCRRKRRTLLVAAILLLRWSCSCCSYCYEIG